MTAQGGQNPRGQTPDFQAITASAIQKDGDTVRMSEFTLVLKDGTRLTADEAVVTGKTIDLRGNVRLTMP